MACLKTKKGKRLNKIEYESGHFKKIPRKYRESLRDILNAGQWWLIFFNVLLIMGKKYFTEDFYIYFHERKWSFAVVISF